MCYRICFNNYEVYEKYTVLFMKNTWFERRNFQSRLTNKGKRLMKKDMEEDRHLYDTSNFAK